MHRDVFLFLIIAAVAIFVLVIGVRLLYGFWLMLVRDTTSAISNGKHPGPSEDQMKEHANKYIDALLRAQELEDELIRLRGAKTPSELRSAEWNAEPPGGNQAYYSPDLTSEELEAKRKEPTMGEHAAALRALYSPRHNK